MSSSAVRVVVSGSREFTDEQVIRTVLRKVWMSAAEKFPGREVVLVHGAARGADQVAARVWGGAGLPLEAHPARWKAEGKGAGFKRNIRMLEAGADLVVAFHVDRSPGTEHTVREAAKRGVPVWYIAVRDGELKAPIVVTAENLAAVFPRIERKAEAADLTLLQQASEIEAVPVYHDRTAGFDRCGACGRPRHDGSLCEYASL